MTKQEIAAIHDEFFASLAFFQEQEMAQGREFYFSVVNDVENRIAEKWFFNDDDFLWTNFYLSNKASEMIFIRLFYYYETKQIEILIRGSHKWIDNVGNLEFHKDNNNWRKEINLPEKSIHEKIAYFIGNEKPAIESFFTKNTASSPTDFYYLEMAGANYTKQLRLRKKAILHTNFLNTNTKKAMPFALRYLEVENFRGINNLKLENLPIDAHWIFLSKR